MEVLTHPLLWLLGLVLWTINLIQESSILM